MNLLSLKPEELPDLTIESLGAPTFNSPLRGSSRRFVSDATKVLAYSCSTDIDDCHGGKEDLPAFETAGPREKIYFDPKELNCGIVTCGGLCPGLNDVIRAITLTLTFQYNVNAIYGFRYGYAGVSSNALEDPIMLNPKSVENIHQDGGSILGSSRGPQDPDNMVDQLLKYRIGLLFVIGGDGTLRGASDLAKTIRKRDRKIAVIGIPKTIDKDILGTEHTFGFSTAVEQSRSAICGAHQEAKGAWNGIGLVKLMGRDSGFISAYATLANSDVNYCFVPEVPLVLEGKHGFLNQLRHRLDKKHHAVIVVAEGVELTDTPEDKGKRDASGNVIRQDIGIQLKNIIADYFKAIDYPVTIKYIDPSYIIRSNPANSHDSALCLVLGQYAVHAGMAGKTNMVVGFWNQHCTHVPIKLATLKRKKIDPPGYLWQTVLATTGQEGYSFLRS